MVPQKPLGCIAWVHGSCGPCSATVAPCCSSLLSKWMERELFPSSRCTEDTVPAGCRGAGDLWCVCFFNFRIIYRKGRHVLLHFLLIFVFSSTAYLNITTLWLFLLCPQIFFSLHSDPIFLSPFISFPLTVPLWTRTEVFIKLYYRRSILFHWFIGSYAGTTLFSLLYLRRNVP